MKGSGDFSIGGKLWPGTSKVIEEIGELGQVLGKLIGSHGETDHYDGTDLREKMVEEIGDLRAALDFFEAHNMTEDEKNRIAERGSKKFKRFELWCSEGK